MISFFVCFVFCYIFWLFVFLQVDDMCAAVLYVPHHGIEPRTARSAWHGDRVHVEFHGDDAAFIALADLLCHVEDKGGVHAVVELHLHVKVVLLAVVVFVCARYAVGILPSDAECHESSADDIDILSVLVHIVFQTHAEVDCDGFIACYACVDVRGACHSREVSTAGHQRDASVVMVQDYLRRVDICDGFEHNIEFLYPDIVFLVIDEPLEVSGNLYSPFAGREELLGLVEGVLIAWCMVS